MKNYKLLSFLLFFISVATFAQPGKFKEKRDQVRSLKVAFITSELQLTPDESAKFWPIYNDFEDKQMELKRDRMKSYVDRFESSEKLSEKEATTLLNQMESADDELHQLRKKFISNLKTILPSVKILKLKKAEGEFSKKLLQQYRDKKIRR